jgi:hypothetical protein
METTRPADADDVLLLYTLGPVAPHAFSKEQIDVGSTTKKVPKTIERNVGPVE